MKRTNVLLSLVLSLATVALAGCAGFSGASFPDASINPEQNSLGTIQGSDFGGHAPLVGAHVYVLQPSVTMSAGTAASPQYNAYANLATSLLTASYTTGSAYPTVANTDDPNVPAGWYYETTDSTGSFNISGDYTCTVGLPVYLYLYGGSPTFPSGSNVFSVNQVVVSGAGVVGLSGTATYTLTTTTTQNFYIGEKVVGSGFNALQFNELNASMTVTATNLTTTTFAVTLTSTLLVGNGTYSTTGTITAQPTFNPAVVNLAVLGNCPSTGNFTYNATTNPNGLKYVYVNEVATVAAAYAFQGFTSSASGYHAADYIGTSSTNIAGLQNAALIAGQLYDVQGSNLSTTYAGEGHIARSQTTNGNGIVPQANIDALGNILAACVDSNNTSTTIGSSGISTQCSTLFNYATSTGVPASSSSCTLPCQQPFDIAQAAINIARHPAGPPYSFSTTGSSNFMSALYALPTGNVPFAPYLGTQPNDFTIGIDYVYGSGTNPYTRGPESLAIDKIGNVWITGQPAGGTNYYFFELSPLGVASNVQTQTNYIYGYVTIDSNESAWSGPAFTNNNITYVHNNNSTLASGTPTLGSAPVTYTYDAGGSNATLNTGYFHYAAAADSTGNVYFGDEKTQNSGVDYIATLAGAATNPGVTATQSANALANVNTDASGFSHAAMAAYGYAYFDYNAANGAGTPTVDLVQLSNGTDYTGFPVTNATAGCGNLLDPEQMAVLRSADILQPDYHNQTGTLNGTGSSVFYITNHGVCTELTSATYEAGFNSPFGVAVDGNDYAYITNRGGNTISVLNAQGGTAATTVSVSPSTGYEPQYYPSGSTTLSPMLTNPLNIAIDPSGNAWITDYGNGSVVEIVGVAAPTTDPLSVAAITVSYTQGSIGYKP